MDTLFITYEVIGDPLITEDMVSVAYNSLNPTNQAYLDKLEGELKILISSLTESSLVKFRETTFTPSTNTQKMQSLKSKKQAILLLLGLTPAINEPTTRVVYVP